jgi:hypothetical protein
MKSGLKATTGELILLARRGQQAALAGKISTFIAEFEQVVTRLSPVSQQIFIRDLPKLLRLQQQQDWVGFADVLEYEILPVL